jgi:hypothetical protein
MAGLMVAAALAASAAQAITLPLTVEQLTDASDYVVRGTVAQMWVDRDARGYHWTRVEIEVEQVLEGPAGTDSLRLDVMGGFLGTEGTVSWDSPRFDVGEEVLVFVERLDGPGGSLLVPTGMRQGKYTVRIDPASGRETLVQFNPAPEQPYDHRFIPDPPAVQRVMLGDMIARIQERVRHGWDGQPIPGKSLDRLRAMHPDVSGSEVSR